MNLFEIAAKLTLDSSQYERDLKKAADGSKTAANAIKAMQSPIDRIKDAFSKLSHPVETTKAGWEKLKGAASSLAHPIAAIKSKIDESTTSMQRNQSIMAGLAKKYEESKSKVEKLSDEYKKSVKESGTSSEQSIKLANALNKAEQEANKAEQAMKKYADSVKHKGDEEDKGEKKTSKFAAMLGSGLKDVGKLGVAAVGAAATAVGAVVKQSVDSYGQFEQLRGGAQKIFAGMDFSRIMSDANLAYKDLNMSASQYLEAINLAGATFSQTMGAEKGYETARKGMKAIADFASGTGKPLEEMNQKFQMITRATSSYQSIADQFAGILPQTSADFLAQAQAAGLLSKSYKSLTEVPVAEYQQAVTDMIEKGVASQGLLNNTTNESMETLTGSFAMTKAAWENLVTGFADPTQNIEPLITRFVEALGASIGNMLPTIQQALKGIGTAVEKLVPDLVATISQLASDTLPALMSSALVLLEGLGGALLDNIDILVQDVLDLALQVLEFLTTGDVISEIVNAAFTLVSSLANWLGEYSGVLIDSAIKLILQLVMSLTDPANLTNLIQSAVVLIMSLVQGLLAALPQLIAAAPVIIQNLVSALVELAPLILQEGLSLLWELVKGIIAALPQLISAAGQIISTLLSGLADLGRRMLDVGRNVVQGIWNGISGAVDWLKGKISGWVGNVMDFIKGLFGIHSPSKWAQDVVGKNLVLGLAEGIDKNTDAVYGAYNDMLSGLNDADVNVTMRRTDNGSGETQEEILADLRSVLNRLQAIEPGTLVGMIAPDMDAALGDRQMTARRRLA